MLLRRTINTLWKFSSCRTFSSKPPSFAVEPNMKFVIKNISKILECNSKTALMVYETCPNLRCVTALSQMERNIELLTSNGVSKELIGENPFLLNLKIDEIQRKLDMVKRMRPDHIDDFIPLLDMTENILREVAVMSAHEWNVIPENSRIYYLSKELQIEPVTVSKYCSKYPDIFFISFPGIVKKLNILLDYNVDGKQILNSLYIFVCADKVIISRLEDLISNGCYDIKPWYFKCTDRKFRKVLVDEKKNARIPNDLANKISKRNSEKSYILNELNSMLSCDDKISAQIYYNFINDIRQLDLAKENCDLLTDHSVSLEFIQNNAVVLTLPTAQINNNIELIKEMKPNSIEDFLPLVEVDTSKLKTFVDKANEQQVEHQEAHPIYYFSKKLNVPATIVSKYFAKYSVLIFSDFVLLKKKLDILASYNVLPMSILQSPDTFKASTEKIESRLIDLKSKGFKNISSYMIVVDASRLEATAERIAEEKTTFDDTTNTVDYVSKRLKWDEITRERAVKYYPPLANCNVIKVKAHLDYLLNETHFTAEDITSNPSVFRTNVEELRLRINELAEIGLKPRKLYSICLARNAYLQMVGSFCKKKNCPIAFERFKLIEKRIKKL